MEPIAHDSTKIVLHTGAFGSRVMSAMQQALFRQESIEARSTAWLGRPVVRLALPVTLISVLSVALSVATLALVVFGSYARRVDLHGIMLPSTGLIRIAAPGGGFVQSLHVHDGQTVAKGDLLYVVNVGTATKSGETQARVLHALQRQHAALVETLSRTTQSRAAEKKELEASRANLQAQMDQTSHQLSLEDAFNDILKKTLDLYAGLVQRHVVRRDEFEARQQNWMQNKLQAETLRTARIKLAAQSIGIDYQLATFDLQTANRLAGIRSRMLDLDQQIATTEAHQSLDVRAPGPGTVTAIVAKIGQTVAAGAPMLTIVPRGGTLQAELLAPSSAIGFTRPGERVRLRYAAFPYQKFGQHLGTVTQVSRSALNAEATQSLLGTPLPPGAGPLYRVVVRPDQPFVLAYGHTEKLQPSMQVQADVLLERRPLYQWILEPLYGLRRSF